MQFYNRVMHAMLVILVLQLVSPIYIRPAHVSLILVPSHSLAK